MSYLFGWWDFVEVNGEQQMVCRDSDERVVMVRDLEEPWLAKATAEHPKRPADRWKRFEYRHEEFWFPLIVNWVPEEGRILVDYNLSSELWRLETNAETEYPPYGGWVRVDDMVPDAFWCWPGYLDQLAAMLDEKKRCSFAYDTHGIFVVGHWCVKNWEERSLAKHVISPDSDGLESYNYGGANLRLNGLKVCRNFRNEYENSEQLPRDPLPLDSLPRISEWNFFIANLKQFSAGENKIVDDRIHPSWSLAEVEDDFLLKSESGNYLNILRLQGDRFPLVVGNKGTAILHSSQPTDGYHVHFTYIFWYSSAHLKTHYELTTFLDNNKGERSFSVAPVYKLENGVRKSQNESHRLLAIRLINDAFFSWKGVGEDSFDENSLSKLGSKHHQKDIRHLQSSSRNLCQIGLLGGRRCTGIGKMFLSSEV